ncbi:MAG: hypothetical protein Hals2KO_28620 [Halioglobus sp.]
MEDAPSGPAPSLAGRLIKFPIQGLWFLVKHPVLTLFLALLIIFSSFSFLAHFNPAIAGHFSNAAAYFGASALVSEIPHLKKKVTSLEATVTRKNAEIKSKSRIMADSNHRMSRFRERGAKFRISSKSRFKKIAISDTAGEILGWLPVIGDIASMGLAAGGIYEMCQMFKEIEAATEELGATYQVYTDTFCEQSIDKNTTLVAEKAAEVKGEFVAMTTVVSNQSRSSMGALVANIQSWLDQAYTLLRNLYDSF